MKDNHTIIIAAALEEELIVIREYFHAHYTVDTATQNALNNLEIFRTRNESAKVLIHKEGFGYVRSAAIQKIDGEVYYEKRAHAMYSYILLQVGVGADMVKSTIDSVCNELSIDSIVLVGSCLGISTQLKKFDIVKANIAYCYENSDNNIVPTMDTTTFNEDVVVLTGNVFVNIVKRNKLGYRGFNILPKPAADMVTQLVSKHEHIAIVLDMESGFVYEMLQRYKPVPHFRVIRIVLDTLQDTQPINYRADVKTCSEMLCEEIKSMIQ